MLRARLYPLLLLCLLLCGTDVLLAGRAAAAEDSGAGASVSVEFSVKPLLNDDGRLDAGDELLIGFRISDSQSGFRVSGLHPAAWITPRESGREDPDQAACEDKIRTLAQLGVSRADEDLNGYYILTLNADDTVAIINPVISLNSSHLKALVPLNAKVGDWDFDARTALAYITLPDKGEVAIVDIKASAIKIKLNVGDGPQAVRVQPDGRYVWVGNDASGTVSVLSSDGSQVAKTIEVGKGPIDFAFDARGRFAFVSSADTGTVSVIEVSNLRVSQRIEAGAGQLHLAYSPLADALYVLNASSGDLMIVLPQSGRTTKTLSLGIGTSSLGTSPDGRYLLALNPEKRVISVIDTAASALRRILSFEEKPTHLLFSSLYAYVYHGASSNVSLIQLSGLGQPETPPVITIPMGVESPEKLLAQGKLLPMALLPEEGGAVVANPADKVIYFYTDGMMSPMGSFKTYTAPPLGLHLYDRSLQERGTTGFYETIARIDKPGIYDVPFVLSSPKVVNCFRLEIAGESEQLATPLPLFRSRFAKSTFLAGQPSRLRFEVVDRSAGKPIDGIEDVRVLATKLGQNWSARPFAAGLGEGIYEAELIFPEAGTYQIFIGAHSLGLRFGDIDRLAAVVELPPTESASGEAR